MKKRTAIVLFFNICLALVLLSFAARVLSADDSCGARRLVCLDPGHEDAPDYGQEPVAPGSAETKPRVSAGCRGVVTKTPEYELNLQNALLLEQQLKQDGYDVLLTRRENHVRISNVERAEFANTHCADLVVRLHADYSPDRSKSGASILVPDHKLPFAAASAACAEDIKTAMTKAGFAVYATVERSDLSGFNWSQVPVVLVETGFMSNPDEDVKLSKPAYRAKLMRSIADGIEAYFGARQLFIPPAP